MNTIDDTLKERGSRYGVFERHAAITQGLKREMIASPNWDTLTDSMREALEMVMHKIGRILNGDPNYPDSWHDIIGYIRLVEQELEEVAVLNREIDAVEETTTRCLDKAA
jgi:hypothetical protein